MKVVVADDSRAFLAVVQRALQSAGYEAVGVTSWLELPKTVARERPDAVVIDASMPVLEGIQLVEVTRRHWPELPIVLMAGEPFGELANQAQAAGATAYVAKTDVPTQLGRVIDHVLRRRTATGRHPRVQGGAEGR